jgi:hypothetical protein
MSLPTASTAEVTSSNESNTTSKQTYDPFVPIAESTVLGYETAEKRFNEFAKECEYPKLADLTKEQMLGEIAGKPDLKMILRQYCTFILKYIQKDGTHIMPGTQKQYLSGVMNAIKRKHADLKILQPWSVQWYTDIYGALKIRGKVEAICRGDSIGERTEGIHRELLIDIAEALLKRNTSESIQGRAVLVMLYHAVGRGGEVSTSNWNTALWEMCRGGRFYLDWGETKGAKHSFLDFFPDAEDCPICMIHSLAAYLITSPGTVKSSTVDPSGPSWIFPTFVNMADGGAASKASRILKSLVEEVEGLTSGHTAHGLRAGAADDMLLNKLCNVIGAIFRGNWDFTGECVLFRYLFGKLFTSQAGKVLAGYENPDQEVAYPDLSILFESAEQIQLLENLATAIFSVDLLHEKALKPFRNAMLASLLMYHDSLRAKYGREHLIVQTLEAAATRLNITTATLRDWGKKIEQKLREKNSVGAKVAGSAEERAAIEIRGLRKENIALNTRLATMEDYLKKMMNVQDRMSDSLEKLARNVSRKRRRADSLGDDSELDVSDGDNDAAPKEGDAAVAVNSLNAMMKRATQTHDWKLAKGTATRMQVSKLITLVTVHRLRLDDPTPFGPAVPKSEKNKCKTVYEHALQCGRNSSSPEIVKAVGAVLTKAPSDPASTAYGAWQSAVNKAVVTLERNQLSVLATAIMETEAWKNGKKGETVPELSCGVGALYNKICEVRKISDAAASAP